MIVLAGLCMTLTWLLARPSGVWVTRERLGAARTRSVSPRHLVAPLIGASLLCLIAVGLSAAQLLVAITIAGVATFALRQVSAERARRRSQARRDAVAEALGLMAAELRVGLLPRRVLTGLAPDFPFLAAAARAAELGGDVSSALRAESLSAGHELLSDLAGAWSVAERAGAPLAHALDRLEVATREDREIEREVQSGVAPARATGRLMAVLPVVGLSMGAGMGADPLGLMVGTLHGALCLAAGAACACAGVAWVNRIAASGERSR